MEKRREGLSRRERHASEDKRSKENDESRKTQESMTCGECLFIFMPGETLLNGIRQVLEGLYYWQLTISLTTGEESQKKTSLL